VIKIGIIGIGKIGSLHLEKFLDSPYYKVIGCYDADFEKLQRVTSEYAVKPFTNVDELIHLCDAVAILSSAESHFFYAEKCIKFGKHVFIDKPMSKQIDEAKRLVELIKEAGIKFQIGHSERFNPAFLAIQHLDIQPMFIESHRLLPFDKHRTTESIIFDDMLHDIDIVLSVVKANIRSINASGVSVLSDQIDIANARIEFDNGCVANLTAGRTSIQKMRKMQFFQKDHQISLDFFRREAEVLQLSEIAGQNSIPLRNENDTKYLNNEMLVPEEYDALKIELNSFAECLIFNSEPKITASDGLKCTEVANEILLKINKLNGNNSSITPLVAKEVIY